MTQRDHSRGDLPPAENYQADMAEPESIGWPETIGFSIFLVLCAAMLAVI